MSEGILEENRAELRLIVSDLEAAARRSTRSGTPSP
jgi:hypothetical protein